jgi:hypothetical protein
MSAVCDFPGFALFALASGACWRLWLGLLAVRRLRRRFSRWLCLGRVSLNNPV